MSYPFSLLFVHPILLRGIYFQNNVVGTLLTVKCPGYLLVGRFNSFFCPSLPEFHISQCKNPFLCLDWRFQHYVWRFDFSKISRACTWGSSHFPFEFWKFWICDIYCISLIYSSSVSFFAKITSYFDRCWLLFNYMSSYFYHF